MSTFLSQNRPQRFPWAEWGILFEYPVDTNPVAPDRQPVALRAGPCFRSFRLHIYSFTLILCSEEENVFKENGKCIPQESEKFTLNFNQNLPEMRSYVRNFFVQCLGSQSLKHPKSLKNASKTTQGVAVRCNQSSIRLHIAMKRTTYSTIIIHPSYYQFASPEYPKCHRHSIWVLCSSPTKMSKHWDHGNDGWGAVSLPPLRELQFPGA